MKTKRYKGKTKNKRNKKTRTRGGATQQPKGILNSLLQSFDEAYTTLPQTRHSLTQSGAILANAGVGVVSAGAESSASILRAASAVTKNIGNAVELAGQLTGKTVVRGVGTANMATNATFGSISLVGQAGRLLYISSSNTIKGLTNFIERDSKALRSIEILCQPATASEGETVGPIDTEDCMRKYNVYLMSLIENRTKDIKGLLPLMQITLDVKKTQIKALLTAIGCKKNRRWYIGQKIYNCDAISGSLSDREKGSVLVEQINDDTYKYMPRYKKGAKGKTIHLVDEYTRLKHLQDKLLTIVHKSKLAQFLQQSNDLTTEITQSGEINPLPYIHRKISTFQKENHCKQIYAELVSQFETPFNNFCILLVQILDFQGQLKFDEVNERLLLEEMAKIDETEQITSKETEQPTSEETEIINMDNIEQVDLFKKINGILKENENQENVTSESELLEKLSDSEQSNGLHGGGKTMKNIYNEAINKYNKAVKKAKNSSNYVFGDTTSQKPLYNSHTTGTREQLDILEKNRRNAEATKKYLLKSGLGVTTVTHNGGILNSKNTTNKRHSVLRREALEKALSNKQKIEQNSNNRNSRLTSSEHNIDTAYGGIKGISKTNANKPLPIATKPDKLQPKSSSMVSSAFNLVMPRF